MARWDLSLIHIFYAENIRNCFSLYGQINKVLQEDAALVELVRSHATGVYYPDAELKTLTIDVGFYISRHCMEKDAETEEVDTPAENEMCIRDRPKGEPETNTDRQT